MTDPREMLDAIQQRALLTGETLYVNGVGHLRVTGTVDFDQLVAALRAVLDMHKRFEWDHWEDPNHTKWFCDCCLDMGGDFEDAHYPCDTVRAITVALGCR